MLNFGHAVKISLHPTMCSNAFLNQVHNEMKRVHSSFFCGLPEKSDRRYSRRNAVQQKTN